MTGLLFVDPVVKVRVTYYSAALLLRQLRGRVLHHQNSSQHKTIKLLERKTPALISPDAINSPDLNTTDRAMQRQDQPTKAD